MSGLILRAPTLADAPAVCEMLVARDLADYGRVDVVLEDLRDEWSAPGVELQADAVVAQDDDGEIVAYAIMHRPGALGFVAPSHEGRGIGSALIDWGQRRERAQGRPRHRQAAATSNARARELFIARGYAYERSYSRMARALEAADADADPLAGTLVLRALAPERDAQALHALDDLCFSANVDYLPATLQEFVGEHLSGHDLAPELSLVAHDGDTMVAFLVARRWRTERAGFIELLAVHPRWRRRGIGAGLLITSFARFAADGLVEAQLSVASDNPRALALYERVGMRPRFVLDCYERALDGSVPEG